MPCAPGEITRTPFPLAGAVFIVSELISISPTISPSLQWAELKALVELLNAKVDLFTQLVDVMFVLLIVFMVTIPVIRRAVKIDPPQASIQKEDTEPAQATASIDADCNVLWNDQKISDDARQAKSASERRFMARKVPPVPVLTPTERLTRQQHMSRAGRW